MAMVKASVWVDPGARIAVVAPVAPSTDSELVNFFAVAAPPAGGTATAHIAMTAVVVRTILVEPCRVIGLPPRLDNERPCKPLRAPGRDNLAAFGVEPRVRHENPHAEAESGTRTVEKTLLPGAFSALRTSLISATHGISAPRFGSCGVGARAALASPH